MRGKTCFRCSSPVYLQTHWQRVDEHPHYPIGARFALHPSKQHRAEHHVPFPADLPQHGRPSQMEQARRCDPQSTSLLADALR